MYKASAPSSAGQVLNLSAVSSLTCSGSLNILVWQMTEEKILRLHLARSSRRDVKRVVHPSLPVGRKCEVFFCSRLCWVFVCLILKINFQDHCQQMYFAFWFHYSPENKTLALDVFLTGPAMKYF